METRYRVYRLDCITRQTYNNGEPVFEAKTLPQAKEYAKQYASRIRIANEKVIIMEERGYVADGCWWSQVEDQKMVSWAKS